MSTELHRDDELTITRFFGGDKRGLCIQLTDGFPKEIGGSYVQLTEVGCRNAVRVISAHLSELDRKEAVRTAVQELANWKPGWPSGCVSAYHEEYDEVTEAEEIKRANGSPFFTEAFTYEMFGKEEARTVLALFEQLCRAAGAPDYHELQEEEPTE